MLDDAELIQVRSEDGSLDYFHTLAEAIVFADANRGWKISFAIPSGERVRLILLNRGPDWSTWVYEPMPTLEELTSEHR